MTQEEQAIPRPTRRMRREDSVQGLRITPNERELLIPVRVTVRYGRTGCTREECPDPMQVVAHCHNVTEVFTDVVEARQLMSTVNRDPRLYPMTVSDRGTGAPLFCVKTADVTFGPDCNGIRFFMEIPRPGINHVETLTIVRV